jgi:hypothetical protein
LIGRLPKFPHAAAGRMRAPWRFRPHKIKDAVLVQ